jgi:nucleotide-binding universal stress UspA family protein
VTTESANPTTPVRGDGPPRRPGRQRSRRTILLAVLLAVVLVAAGLFWYVTSFDDGTPTAPSPSAGPGTGPTEPEDALQRRTLAELGEFTDWLEANDAEGYIGEFGIDKGEDVDRWLALADLWFQKAEDAGLWLDGWSSGEWWGTDYQYVLFLPEAEDGPLARPAPTGELLARVAAETDLPRGVNVSGAEFGSPGSLDEVTEFSNENLGEHGVDYRWEPEATFRFLAEQGLDTVRIPFRWERIQPQLGGELDPAELGRLEQTVKYAEAAGLDVILDVHNYGAYHLAEGGQGVRRPIGSAQVPVELFADLWDRLSDALADQPGILAYDLMNEPVYLVDNEEDVGGAQVWEAASQAAVEAIRANGDDKLIMVAGYQWSNAQTWTENHDDAWIDDPADNIRYEAHHYWQREEDNSYDTELAGAEEEGY